MIIFLSILSQIGLSTTLARPQVNVEVTDEGKLQSLNITGNEFDKSIARKNHKIMIGDGLISPLWDEVSPVKASAYGENGEIYSVYGSSDVFFLIIQDLDINWIAMQWDTSQTYSVDEMQDREMEEGDDMWIFGETEKVSVLGDAKAHSTEEVFIVPDKKDDLEWDRVVINDTDEVTPLYVAWEIRRAKNTNDVAGGDVVFNSENSTSLRIASSGSHKQDNNLYEFILSDVKLGGAVPTSAGDETITDINVSGFFYKYISLGILYGIIAWLVVFIPSGFILRSKMKSAHLEVL